MKAGCGLVHLEFVGNAEEDAALLAKAGERVTTRLCVYTHTLSLCCSDHRPAAAAAVWSPASPHAAHDSTPGPSHSTPVGYPT